MRTWRKAVSGLLAAVLLLTLVPLPMARAVDTSSASGTGIQIEQKAEWDPSIPGGTAVKVTVNVSTDMDLTTPKDVVFVVNCAALQNLDAWKRDAKELADYLSTVPGMRAALVSFSSQPTRVLGFTADFTALKNKIDGLTRGGATPMPTPPCAWRRL